MEKFKLIRVSVVFLLILSFAGCQKENRCDCFKRTGSVVTKTREVSGFDKLLVEDNLNVFITQDSVFEVKIEAGDNLIPLIKTEVIDGTLKISNKNRCNWARSYNKPFNVYIKMPTVNFITSDGTGNIKSLNTITTPSFNIQIKNSGDIELTVNNYQIVSKIRGSGDLTLHGVVHDHSCDIGGTAFLNCQDLLTNYTYIHTFTTGLCYVNSTDRLLCRIDKMGDVYCYGNPVNVEQINNGQGQLYLK